ncbi:DUF2085 domain-containing protein [Brevibacillus ginsengisoli]|uniref:DUF2085 domain-containing protein n=1 Tax=Brevibacillus ginsengisoli TaxID=363854 RepID=UPI003CEC9FA9
MRIPCHRNPARSFFINGKQMPLCARCTAILLGYLMLPVFLFVYPSVPFYIGLLLQVPMLIDGYTQLRKWRESTNWLRALTGFLSGAGQSAIVVSVSLFFIQLILNW